MLILACKRLVRRASQLGVVTLLLTGFVLAALSTSFVTRSIEANTIDRALKAAPVQDSQVIATFDGHQKDFPQNDIQTAVAKAFNLKSSDDALQAISFRTVADPHGNVFQVVYVPQQLLAIGNNASLSSCTQSSCPVYQVQGSSPIEFAPLQTVGTANLVNPWILKVASQPENNVLVTTDYQGLSSLSFLDGSSGSQIWSQEVKQNELSELGSQKYIKSLASKADQFSLVSGRLSLKYPDSIITAASRQAGNAIRRIEFALNSLAILVIFSTILLAHMASNGLADTGRIVSQLTKGSIRQFTYTSMAVTFAIPMLLSVLIYLTSPSLAFYVFGILLAAWVACIVTLETNHVWATTLLGVVVTLMGLLTKQPEFVALTAAAGMALVSVRFVLRKWKSPFALSVSRSTELLSLTALVAIIAGLIGAWAISFANLDRQEHLSIDYSSPLKHRYAGLQAGIFSDHALDDFGSAADTYAVSKISATASDSSGRRVPVQVIGIPSNLELVDQTPFGGPSQKQLSQALSTSESDKPIFGSGTSLRVSGVPLNVECGVWTIDRNGDSKLVGCDTELSAATQILGIELYESTYELARREHAANEGNHSVPAPKGTVSIESAPGQFQNADIDLQTGPAFISLSKETPVLHGLARSDVATPGDDVIVKIGASASVKVHIDSTTDQFATAPGAFIVVNRSDLNSYLALSDPGLIKVTEIWSDSDSTVAAEKSTKLQVWDRQIALAAFAIDPIRNQSRQALVTFAFLAVVILLGLITLINRSMTVSANLPEWVRRGVTASELSKDLFKVVAKFVLLAVVIGVATSSVLLQLLPSQIVNTWNGAPAVPAIPHSMNLVLVGEITISLLTLSAIGYVLGGGKSNVTRN